MLANGVGVYFFLLSISQWTAFQMIGYFMCMLTLIEVLNWGVFWAFETPERPRIAPGGQALFDRTFKDYAFIAFNKTATVVFTYHLAHYCYYTANFPRHLDELTLFNTLPAFVLLFIVYDFSYSLFHRFLHVREVYGYIHKHHHRQAAPIQGHDDAVNTHPFEFICGEYNHLLAIMLVPCHLYTAIAFIAVGGVLASLSHTRFDITVKMGKIMLYSVKEHDTHHKMLRGNYGQYTQVWDRVFGTFFEWTEPGAPIVNPPPTVVTKGISTRTSTDGGGPNRPPPFAPEYCSKTACEKMAGMYLNNQAFVKYAQTNAKVDRAAAVPVVAHDAPAACAVTNASSPLGRRLIAALKLRGASRIVAIDLGFPSASVMVSCPFNIFDENKSSSSASTSSASAAGASAKASSSSSSSSQTDIYKDVELLSIDLADVSSQDALSTVLAGVHTVFHLLPHTPAIAPSQDMKPLIDVAKLLGRDGLKSKLARDVAKAKQTAVHPLYSSTSNILSASRRAGVRSVVLSSAAEARVLANEAVEGWKEADLLNSSATTQTTVVGSNSSSRSSSSTSSFSFPSSVIELLSTTAVSDAHQATIAAESLVMSSNTLSFRTCVLAAHNVYGPENGFVSNLISMNEATWGRIASGGNNVVSFTHVENLCHALVLAAAALAKPIEPMSSSSPAAAAAAAGSSAKRDPVGGKYLIVTDGDAQFLWDVVESVQKSTGGSSNWDRYHVYNHVLLPVAWTNQLFSLCDSKLTPVLVHAATQHRYFNIDEVRSVLGYAPLLPFVEGMKDAVHHVKHRWGTLHDLTHVEK